MKSIITLVLVLLTFEAQAVDVRPLNSGAFAEVLAQLDASDEPSAEQMKAMAYVLMGRQDLVSELESVPFAHECRITDGQRVQPSRAWLLDAIRDERVVMFNENHYHTAARAYVYGLLSALRELGFTHLGLEAMMADADAPKGLYTDEPVFAALIRRANELGFEVFGYEPRMDLPADMHWMEQVAHREAGQAEHIATVMERAGPDAKFVIFAGWSHIREQPQINDEGSIEWMAMRLRKITALDPFTVDFTRCVFEASIHQDGRVVVDADDAVVVLEDVAGSVDAQVQLPVPMRGASTPGYYRSVIGDRQPIATPAGYEEVPLLFRAWRPSVGGTPIDQMMVQPGEQAVLYLPQGAYTITVQDGTGKVVSRHHLSVARLNVPE